MKRSKASGSFGGIIIAQRMMPIVVPPWQTSSATSSARA